MTYSVSGYVLYVSVWFKTKFVSVPTLFLRPHPRQFGEDIWNDFEIHPLSSPKNLQYGFRPF